MAGSSEHNALLIKDDDEFDAMLEANKQFMLAMFILVLQWLQLRRKRLLEAHAQPERRMPPCMLRR